MAKKLSLMVVLVVILGGWQTAQQFPLGYRPYLRAATALRIRNTFGTAVNA